MKNAQELQALRDQKRKAAKVTAATCTQIFVGMGTCGIAAGARETLGAIKDELARRHIEAVVTPVGCIGICVKEPLVDIQQAGGSHVLYANVQPDMVGRLIEEHVLRGQPVKEWVVCRMTVD